MRTLYTAQLEELKTDLTEIGALCETAIDHAMDAFLTSDMEYVKTAKVLEHEINAKEKAIERSCLTMLLHQQPVASDFRIVSAALKMITDIERIGDQAYDIANIAADDNQHNPTLIPDLSKMGKEVCYMVRESIAAFVNTSEETANAVIAYDDIVDDLFTKVRSEIIINIKGESGSSEAMLDELMVAKYLERIADHATNIAEWVLFSINGKGLLDEHE